MTRFAAALFLALSTAVPRLAAQTFTITNATIVDVSNGALRGGSTIVVDGNRIVSAGPASAATAVRGEVVDAKGMYVIPGLWDMHTHAYFGWTSDFGDSYVLPLLIANGVTGIRDMGSDLDAVLRARSEVAAHRLVGPRMVISGPMVCGPTGALAAAIVTAPPDARRPRSRVRGGNRERDARRWTESRRHAQDPGRRLRQDSIGRAARRLLRDRDRGEEGRHRFRGTRARRDPCVGGRHGRPANVRTSHRHLRGEHARRRRSIEAQVRRREGSVDQQEPRHLSRSLRCRARGEHHWSARQEHGVAVPHAVLGARPVAR